MESSNIRSYQNTSKNKKEKEEEKEEES